MQLNFLATEMELELNHGGSWELGTSRVLAMLRRPLPPLECRSKLDTCRECDSQTGRHESEDGGFNCRRAKSSFDNLHGFVDAMNPSDRNLH